MAFYISKKRKCVLCKCLNVMVKSIFIGFRLGEMRFMKKQTLMLLILILSICVLSKTNVLWCLKTDSCNLT